ncbi:hypothetical protein Lxx03980 [Leifsonia xyli subsp. xyli str. CTCB07]|uniref:Uncharacterized protein n=1 Tax=Leifsonia xyli subsp. xyli (strain CTCB07) TaxID=281090 RepID=Q6AGU3_LEIXX|nr:hypothetical protein [Leifsonia xyli]AAT88402.1 hypothetical protein Lxx03980 [Leifsonia xyli subsp. xyli str. CTCB07]
MELKAWEANGKSRINLTVTNPTLATIIQRPKHTPEATGNPGWAATPTPDPWDNVPPADDTPF